MAGSQEREGNAQGACTRQRMPSDLSASGGDGTSAPTSRRYLPSSTIGAVETATAASGTRGRRARMRQGDRDFGHATILNQATSSGSSRVKRAKNSSDK